MSLFLPKISDLFFLISSEITCCKSKYSSDVYDISVFVIFRNFTSITNINLILILTLLNICAILITISCVSFYHSVFN